MQLKRAETPRSCPGHWFLCNPGKERYGTPNKFRPAIRMASLRHRTHAPAADDLGRYSRFVRLTKAGITGSPSSATGWTSFSGNQVHSGRSFFPAAVPGGLTDATSGCQIGRRPSPWWLWLSSPGPAPSLLPKIRDLPRGCLPCSTSPSRRCSHPCSWP